MTWSRYSDSNSVPSSVASYENLVVIALGSNLGDSSALITSATKHIAQITAEPIRISSILRSAPVDCPPGSPDFLNAILTYTPARLPDPHLLLEQLQSIETDLGRTRSGLVNEPRMIDLDLIACGGIVLKTDTLTLPHPRATQRLFVLSPLAELAPKYQFPNNPTPIELLIEQLS